MIEEIKKIVHNTIYKANRINQERIALMQGRILANQQYSINSDELKDYEFKVFSQFGDDGIIQYLIKNIEIKNETFIEFGVENYLESNTRFLLQNNNWSGFVMDASERHMKTLQSQDWFWQHDLRTKTSFITKENINATLSETNFEDLGLLHIDLDGNDYWILEALNLEKLNPSILILEYNSVFGDERAISVPYDESFNRTQKHYSNLYWGASLSALTYLANKKDYALIGCNCAGNNAYFVKRGLLNKQIKEKDIKNAYVESKYRESRDNEGKLSFLRSTQRLEAIKGLDVFNTITQEIEKL